MSRGSQTLPDIKPQRRLEGIGMAQAQRREQTTSSRAVGEMGTFLTRRSCWLQEGDPANCQAPPLHLCPHSKDSRESEMAKQVAPSPTHSQPCGHTPGNL